MAAAEVVTYRLESGSQPLDQVLKFPNVAWPRVSQQIVNCFWRDLRDLFRHPCPASSAGITRSPQFLWPSPASGLAIYACTDLHKRNVYDYQWSTADLLDLRATAASTIEDAAGVNTLRVVLQHDSGQPEEIAQAPVTIKLFRVLGARVILGRDFIDSDTLPQPILPNRQPVTVIQQLLAYGLRPFVDSPGRLFDSDADAAH
jgi:hypothetical protein